MKDKKKHEGNIISDDQVGPEETTEEGAPEIQYEWGVLESILETTGLDAQIQKFFLLEAETSYAAILTALSVVAKTKKKGLRLTAQERSELLVALAQTIAGKISRQPALSPIVAPRIVPIAPANLSD